MTDTGTLTPAPTPNPVTADSSTAELKAYIFKLEGALINALGKFDSAAHRLQNIHKLLADELYAEGSRIDSLLAHYRNPPIGK